MSKAEQKLVRIRQVLQRLEEELRNCRATLRGEKA
jgi:hypothetical protein